MFLLVGSVTKFLDLKSNSYFPITDKSMTRFNISLKDAYTSVIWSLNYSYGEMWYQKFLVIKLLI